MAKIWVLEFVDDRDDSTCLGVFSSPEKAKAHVEGERTKNGCDEWIEDDTETEVSWLLDEAWFQISEMHLDWIDDDSKRASDRAGEIMGYALRNYRG